MKYFFNSPFGELTYDWDGRVCFGVWFGRESETPNDDSVSDWLGAYFMRNTVKSLPPLAEPTTPFQDKLRLGLLSIPQGEVLTYGELAGQLNTSPRGLGQALGANLFPILIPCHRVISADGLGGFSGGLDWKEKLLNFEKT